MGIKCETMGLLVCKKYSKYARESGNIGEIVYLLYILQVGKLSLRIAKSLEFVWADQTKIQGHVGLPPKVYSLFSIRYKYLKSEPAPKHIYVMFLIESLQITIQDSKEPTLKETG